MKVLSIVSTVFTLIFVLAIAVFFVVEKPIPLAWAQQSISDSAFAVCVPDFDELKALKQLGCKKTVTEYDYDEAGERIFASKIAISAEVVTSGSDITMRKIWTEYDQNDAVISETAVYYFLDNGIPYKHEAGSTTEVMVSEWQEAIVSALRQAFPVDDAGEFLYSEQSQNIESVRQIGLYVIGYVPDGDNSLEFGFDFLNQQLKSVKYTRVGSISGQMAVVSLCEYQVLFPTAIDLPQNSA